MLSENDLTSDEILSKLDQKSRKARTISIAFTLFLLLILGVVTALTYQAGKKYSDLGNNAANLRNSVNELSDKKEKLRAEIAELEEKNQLLNKAVTEVQPCVEDNKNCLEAKNALATVTSNSSAQPTPTPQKIPTNNENANSVSNETSTVYVQITEETQRVPAREIIKKFAGGNFKFPPIELVENTINKTQIRYFREGDRPKADKLADELREKAKIDAVVVSPYQANSSLEVWFSNDAFKK